MRRVILVHGFASPFSGRYDIDRLAPFWTAAGYEVVQFDYGFRLFVSLGNDKWAKRLADMAEPGDTVCAHSNGCLVAQKASLRWVAPANEALRKAPFDRLVFLCPALDSDAPIGDQVRRVDVWYAPHDLPVRIGGLFPKHPWGPMGAVGYTGPDRRVVNHNRESFQYSIKSYTHLDLLYDRSKLNYFGPLIVAES